MSLKLKSAISGVAAAAIAGGVLFAGAGAASAATAPTFEPDPGSVGSVSFYDATGTQITSGSIDDSPLATYYVASGAGVVAADVKAQVAYVTPQDGVPTQSWTTAEAWTANFTYSPAPTYPGSLAGTSNAVAKGAASDGPFSGHIANFPNASSANPGIYQVRLYTNHAGSSGNDTYYSSDIKVTGSTWTQVYPAVATSTSTALTATPDPSTVGDSVTIKATVTPSTAAGTVQFKDGGTNLGSPIAVASGVAQTTSSTLTQGSHSLSAVFTPTDTSAFSTSTGTVTATVNPAATPTTTTLGLSGDYVHSGQDATLTAAVANGSTPVSAGTVAFFDNGSGIAIPGTVDTSTPGTYVLDVPSGFTAGSHSIVAKFTPTDVAQFRVSQSAAQNFLTQDVAVGACAQPGAACTAASNVKANIPVGTLVINTPYDSGHPIDLGTLSLSADSKTFSGTAAIDNINVTDTRSGGLGWTVSAISSPLTDGGTNPNSTINAQNLGLTGIGWAAGTGFTGTVLTTDHASAGGVAPGDSGVLGLGGTSAHTVAVSDHGVGTGTLSGRLTLIAPSSTEAGLFAGTITFTVG